MALQPLNGMTNPLGQFDGLDALLTTVKGGEVVTFTYVSTTGTDTAAADVIDDGYVGFSAPTRPAVTSMLAHGNRPLFLVDDGIKHYGTLFGTVVGATCGKNVTGTQIGPHTATGSGKLTLWGQPGMYAVSLDAVDTDNVIGLNPNNPTLAGGDKLYARSTGLLTPDISFAFESVAVARFIEFSTSLDTLVNTPKYLIQANNSPTGTSGNGKSFDWAIIYFHVEE